MSIIWKILYILYIALPIGTNGYQYLSFLNVYHNNINVLDIGLLLLFIYTIIINLKKIVIKKSKLFFIAAYFITLILTMITLMRGYHVYGMSAVNDSFKYFRCLLFIFVGLVYPMLFVDYAYFISCTKKGLYLNFILTVISFVTMGGGQRIGSSAPTLFIIIFPLELIRYLHGETKDKKSFWIMLVVFLAMSAFTQNRTFVFLTILVCVFSTIQIAFTRVKRSTVSKIFFISLMVIVTIAVLLSMNLSFVNRLLHGGEMDTGAGRINTFLYYLNIFGKHYSGFGFGYIMHFVTQHNYVLNAYDTFNIDNALIVYAIKGGILYLVAQMIMLFYPLKKMLKDEKYTFVLILGYIGLFLSSCVMTSQIIHGLAVSAFVWSTVGMSANGQLVIRKEKAARRIRLVYR